MSTKLEESRQNNNTPLSQTRRSALKKMLVGTGVAAGTAVLPDKWVKPVVDRILVPAHAQTSGDQYFSGEVTFNEAASGKCVTDNNSLVERLSTLLIPKAHAGFKKTDGHLCIFMTDDTFTAKIETGPDKQCPGQIFETPDPGKVGGGPVKFDKPCDAIENSIEVTKIVAGGAKYITTGSLNKEGTLPFANSAGDCPIGTSV